MSGFGKKKTVPPKEDLERAYERYGTIENCSIEFEVCSETFRRWLIERGVKRNEQGRNKAKRQRRWKAKDKG